MSNIKQRVEDPMMMLRPGSAIIHSPPPDYMDTPVSLREHNKSQYGGIDRIMLPRPLAVVHEVANGYLVTIVPPTEGAVLTQEFAATAAEVGNVLLRVQASAALGR